MAGGGVPGGGGDDQPIDLNLTALMDILSNILFFLLASFGAAVISVVSASVPVSSADEDDNSKTTDAVTMTVAINPTGYRLTGSSETLTPEETDKLKVTLPRTNHLPKDNPKGSTLNELDFEKLTAALARVKSAFPKSESVIIVPEPTILYDEVVQTMDACREKVDKDAQGKQTKKLLFGKVVVSTTIQ
jgi:biopolymer transport protein ExbD